jgi:quinol monooxygenase YgiN
MPERDETRVVVIAEFTAKPGKEQELSTLLQAVVEPVRREPGCLRYELSQDLHEPATFCFVETYAGQQAFEDHCKMPYIVTLFDALPALVEKQHIGLHRQVLA